MANQVTNKSYSARKTQPNFSESQTNKTLGPNTSDTSTNGEAITTPPSDVVAVNEWVAMTQADQGLLDALYDFINTTKEGITVIPNNFTGRTKKMVFNFYGTMGKSIKPGEIGQFELNFSYPPESSLGTSSSTLNG